MVQIIEARDTGKTRKLLTEAYHNNGIVVCRHPAHMRDKAEAYGLLGLTFMSYTDFMAMNGDGTRKYYIDEVEQLLSLISPNVEGYTITLNWQK